MESTIRYVYIKDPSKYLDAFDPSKPKTYHQRTQQGWRAFERDYEKEMRRASQKIRRLFHKIFDYTIQMRKLEKMGNDGDEMEVLAQKILRLQAVQERWVQFRQEVEDLGSRYLAGVKPGHYY
jgi:DNA repair ATPase RecN